MTKVALITGGARRIGAEIVRQLHASGMRVVIHYRQSEAEASLLCDALNKQRSHSAVALQADLLHLHEANDLIEKSEKIWGRLDVLINNASCFFETPVGDVNEDEWDELLNSNLKAPFFLAQAARNYLKKNNGCIVNIADIHGEKPLGDYSVYSISKAGLIMLTKALAKELGPEIRVNAVSPAGGACWPEGENALSEKAKEKIIQQTTLKRAGSPKDIASAVQYLVLQASYVTGQILVVDGGRY